MCTEYPWRLENVLRPVPGISGLKTCGITKQCHGTSMGCVCVGLQTA